MFKILIVDDTAICRNLIHIILASLDIEIIDACDGKDAIIKYDEYEPDLVFMDVMMPVMDGITATSIITTNHVDANIVMCSSEDDESVISNAMASGAKDYILKPISTDAILNVVEKYMNKK